ncbi:sensor domain-containing diguanylate cyclase [Motiliproteus sediminis]|uniref:sensor domain-containing diguanylate cyclase n=1 Tax=Motiliproteus sediminis TaxID=1468178 RepID=UPI001AEF987D|nr:diguanylate cyclase [Motiliproteus sediminis]
MVNTTRERILAALAASGFLILLLTAIQLGFNYWLHEAERHTRLIALDSAKNLERNVERSLAGAKVLGTYIEVTGGRSDNFEAIADSILHNLQGITNLQLAPDGVIAKIYPLAGNEKAIGHDLLQDDKRRAEARKAIETHKLTLAGPFELVQGGVAIIGRQPVEIEQQFWGFASALIRMDQVMAMSELDQLAAAGYGYKLWRNHPDSGEPQVIAGDRSLTAEILTQATITLPNSTWYLDVAYFKPPKFRAANALALALALLLSLIIGHWVFHLLARPRLLEHQVAVKTDQLQHTNRQLRHERTQLGLFRSAVEQSGNAIVIANSEGVIEYTNPRFQEVTGFSSDEARGRYPSIIKSVFTSPQENSELWQTLKSGNVWRGERRNQRKNGSHYWSLMHIAPIRDEQGSITHYISVSDDITDAKENQLLIEKLAYHDSLTGLANRRYFVDRLEQVVRYSERHQRCSAVLFIDLDRFKAVNDSFGHEVGDSLLVEVANRLLKMTRKSDLCARLGGDEFTVLLTEVDCAQGVYAATEKIIEALRQPLVIDGHDCDVSASIGVSLVGQQHQSAGQVIRQADMALYRAKNAGRDQYRVYQAESDLDASEEPEPH